MKKKSYTVSLQEELIVEILLRLPGSSLLRFKCVCKSWRSLICSSQFAKSHFDLAASPGDRILNRETVFSDFIESTDLSDESVVSLRLPPPPRPTDYKRIRFWGSCRGFVLMRYVDFGDLIIWNPSTGVHKRVPHIGKWSPSDVYGFGYDASTNDYLVIVIKETMIISEIMFFSVKTNSWTYLVDVNDEYEGKELYKRKGIAGLLLNEALHWLVSSRRERNHVIIAFDLQRRSIIRIPLPPSSSNGYGYGYDFELHTIGGCLGVLCRFDGQSELWMMKEYKVLSSWTRISNYASPYCITNDIALDIFALRSEEMETTGKIFGPNICCLKLQEGHGGKIGGINYCYRGLGDTSRKITQQVLCEHFSYGEGVMLHSWKLRQAMYRESLLSLPDDNEQTSQMMVLPTRM